MRRKKRKGKDRPRGSDSDSETDGYGIVHLTDKAQHDRVNLSVLFGWKTGADD